MILDDLLEAEEQRRLSPEVWKKLQTFDPAILFTNFPFFDDPKFRKLTLLNQRFLLAYSLKDEYGFTLSAAYAFASRKKLTPKNRANFSASATKIIKTHRVKYFVDKLDWGRVEALGFTVNKIIEAETELAYSDITEYLDDDGMFSGNLKDLPKGLRRAIKSYEVMEHQDRQGNPVRKYRLQLWDKGASLQRMQKIKGMHVDVAQNTTTSININAEMSATDAAKAYSDMMRGDSQG